MIRPHHLGENSSFLGQTCALCKQEFGVGDEIVFCPEDGSRHHTHCWQAKGRTARVRTCRGEGVVEVLLEFPARLDFTRPEVQRTLLLSRALVEPLGARLAFRQAHGPALHIKLAWPAETGKA